MSATNDEQPIPGRDYDRDPHECHVYVSHMVERAERGDKEGRKWLSRNLRRCPDCQAETLKRLRTSEGRRRLKRAFYVEGLLYEEGIRRAEFVGEFLFFEFEDESGLTRAVERGAVPEDQRADIGRLFETCSKSGVNPFGVALAEKQITGPSRPEESETACEGGKAIVQKLGWKKSLKQFYKYLKAIEKDDDLCQRAIKKGLRKSGGRWVLEQHYAPDLLEWIEENVRPIRY